MNFQVTLSLPFNYLFLISLYIKSRAQSQMKKSPVIFFNRLKESQLITTVTGEFILFMFDETRAALGNFSNFSVSERTRLRMDQALFSV